MTKKHFVDAAAIVRNILQSRWTNDPPAWAITWKDVSKVGSEPHYQDDGFISDAAANYTRAVQTAEAFVLLFTQHNERFDTPRFLIACGLVAAPVKAKRGKRS